MANAEPEYSFQELYDEAGRRGLLKDNPEMQQLGHEARRRGLVKDPTQGGLYPDKAPGALTPPAPAAGAPAPGKPPRPTAASAITTPRITAFQFPRIAAEDAHAAVQARWQKVPAYLRLRPSDTGPVRAIQDEERSSFAALGAALPEIDRQLRGSRIQLQRDGEQLSAARKQYEAQVAEHNREAKAGRFDAARAARLTALGKELEGQGRLFQQNEKAWERRAKEFNTYGQRRALLAQKGEALHWGMEYPEEQAGGSSIAGELYGSAARSWLGQKAGTYLNPAGFLTEAVQKRMPRARAALMAAGAYPALPAPTGHTAVERGAQIDQKNQLVRAAALLGSGLRPDGTVNRRAVPVPYQEVGFGIAHRRAVDEAIRTIQNMTPWQRQILPVIQKQFAAERAAVRMAGLGEAFLKDAGANLIGGLVGNIVGKKVAAAGADRLAQILADEAITLIPAGTSATLRTMPKQVARTLLKPLPAVLGGAAGGAAGAGTAIGAVTYATTGNAKEAVSQGLQAARQGAVAGGVVAGITHAVGEAVGQLKTYRTGDTEVIVDRIAEQWADQFDAPKDVIQQRLMQIAKAPKIRKDGLRNRLVQDLKAGKLRTAAPEAPTTGTPEAGAPPQGRAPQRALPGPEAPPAAGEAPVPPTPRTPAPESAITDPTTAEGLAQQARQQGQEGTARHYEQVAQDLRASKRPTMTAERPAVEIPEAPETGGVVLPAEPRVRMADGAEVRLRGSSEAELLEAQAQAQATGDAAAAGAIGNWIARHEAWRNAHAVVGGQEEAGEFLKAWENLRAPRRRQWQVLTTAAERSEKAGNTDLASALHEAADAVRLSFGFEWAQERSGQLIPVEPNPQESAYRRLAPEQRAGLSEPVRRQLLMQDIENSESVLGVTGDAKPKKGETTAALAARADDLFRQANEELAQAPLPAEQAPLPAEFTLTAPEAEMSPEAEEPQGAQHDFDFRGALRGVPEKMRAERRRVLKEYAKNPKKWPQEEGTLEGQIIRRLKSHGTPVTDEMVDRIIDTLAPVEGRPFEERRPVAQKLIEELFGPKGDGKPASAAPAAPEGFIRATEGEPLEPATERLARLRRQASAATKAAGEAKASGAENAKELAAQARQAVAEVQRQQAIVDRLTKEGEKPAKAERAPEKAAEPTPEAQAQPERRKDTERRRRVAEMSPEEMRRELLTDPLTSLGNQRAYHESEKGTWQASIDADSLKWINDNMGHPAGDSFLRAVGLALKEAGADAYHVSGDEFIAQAATREELEKLLAVASDILDAATFSFKTKEGKRRTFIGMGMSYALAPANEHEGEPGSDDYRPAYANADEQLAGVKAEREKAGLRSPRGERPPRLAEVGEGEGEPGRGDRGEGGVAEQTGDRGDQAAARPEVEETPAPVEPEGVPAKTRHAVIALAAMIREGKAPKTNPELLKWFDGQGLSVTKGDVAPDFVYDVLEAAVNHLVMTTPMRSMSPEDRLKAFRRLIAPLPTQNLRTEGKRELQQFSTPPTLAYLAAAAGAPRAGDVLLEPSAGTGSLAAMAKGIEPVIQVHANEIDPRRRALLEILGFETTGEDAERIDSTLPPEVKPTLVLMNPPFSATGRRVTQHKNEFGYRHVSSAMERLEPGGRLVAILGGGAALGKKYAAFFWKAMTDAYDVRAVIELPGEEYAKYGTTFDNVIAVIDKRPASGGEIVKGKVANLEEALSLLAKVPRPEKEARGEGAAVAGEGQGATRERGPADAGGVEPRAGGQGVRPGKRGTRVRGERGTVPPGAGGAAEPGSQGGAPGVRESQPGTELAGAPRSGGVRRGGGDAADVPAGVAEAKSVPKVTYHGSSGPVNLGMVYDREQYQNLYGPGFYTTADAAIAQEYTRKGKGEEPSIYEVRWLGKKTPRLIDLNLPLPDTVRPYFQQVYGDIFSDELDFSRPGAEIYREVKQALAYEFQTTVDDAQEAMQFLADKMADAGYDGLTHVGGRIRGSKEHQVVIYFHPVDPVTAKPNLEIRPAGSVAEKPAEKPAKAPKPAAQPKQTEESDESVFERYEPVHLKEGKPHPAPIVETKAMAAVAPPAVSYKHHVPKEVVEGGNISAAQLEAVVYNGQAQETFSATGHRHGYLVGDGTGVGKSRTLAAIVADNWNQGRKRAVWVTAQKNTAPEIRDALDKAGLENATLTEASEFKGGDAIGTTEGVIYLTYSSLIRTLKGGKFDGKPRWEQLARWVGEDGVLIFDESHAMKSGTSEGLKKASKTALAGIELQDKFPKLRVTYASATGATDVSNLAYMTRLGLWGPGTAFPDFSTFMHEVGTAGVGAMELVAQNLKALGKYTARSISYQGVEYTEVTHTLTPEQRKMYDTAAEAWRQIFDGFDKGWQTVSSDQKEKARFPRQRLYGDQQRFFRLLLSAIKVPTTIKTIEERLAEGHSVVVSLTNTNEATEKRLAAKAIADEIDLDELDFSPRELLANLVEKHYPVQNMTEVEDEAGNISLKPVWKADGTPEVNPAAVRQREELLQRMGEIYLPENTLDQILFHFGHGAVAELSGRSNRRVRNEKTGKMERVPRKAPDGSSKGVNLKEMAAFQDGKKRIAIITPAADTGISLHASRQAKNQQRRAHILHELSWSADRAMQGNGRTHRTDQASAPEYILVSSDVGGEKRFSATIARRLASLGALTRGHRGASGGGALDKYNFETEYGKAAVERLMEDVVTGRTGDDVLKDAERLLLDMGLLKPDKAAHEFTVPDVRQFFNRLLALDLDRQGALFNAFMDRFGRAIQLAKELGTFDEGVEDLKGENIRSMDKPVTVWSDKATNASTEYRVFQYETPVQRTDWAELQRVLKNVPSWDWARNKKTGALLVVRPWSSRTDTVTGRLIERVHVERPRASASTSMDKTDFDEKYERLTDADPAEMKREWETQVAEVPRYSTHQVHMLSGVVLPIWDKVVGSGGTALKVNRIVTADGERYVGLVLPSTRVRKVLRDLGVGVAPVDPSEAWNRVMGQGDDLPLAGEVTLKRKTWQGEQVVELVLRSAAPARKLTEMGVRPIQDSSWKWRYFLPTDEARGKALLAKVLEEFPVIEGGDVILPQTRAVSFARSVPESGRKGGEKVMPAAGGGGAGRGTPPAEPPGPSLPEDDGSPRRDGEPGEYDDPALRAWEDRNFRASMADPEGMLARAQGQLRELGHFLTRTFRDLPRGKYPTIEALLLKLRRGEEIGHQLAHVHLAKVLRGMTGKKQRQARRTLYRAFVIRDLYQDLLKQRAEIEEGVRAEVVLPDPWTEEAVVRQHRIVNDDLKAHFPELLERVDERAAMNEALFNRLQNAMAKTLGRKPAQGRVDYYRHLVIDAGSALAGVGKDRTKARTRIGFLQERKGSTRGYEQDYVLAEWDWVARAHRELILHELLGAVKEFDIYKELKALALDLNDETAREALLELAKAPDIDAARGVAKGAALRRLTILAEEDALPDTLGGEWNDTIQKLADAKDAPESLLSADWPEVKAYLDWVTQKQATKPGAGAGAVLLQGIQKDAERLKGRLGKVSWQDLIPEGYAAWKLSDAPLYERLDVSPEVLADDAVAAALGEPGRARRSSYLVIPEDLAKTLAREGKGRPDAPVNQFHREWNKWIRGPWVQVRLFGPLSVVPGTLRDWSGHIDASLTGNPEVIRTLPRAFDEVARFYVSDFASAPAVSTVLPSEVQARLLAFGDKALRSRELEEAMGHGLFAGTFTNVEAGSVIARRLNLLGDALAKSEEPLAARVVLGYLKSAQLPRELVENIVTYAHFLSFGEQIAKSPEGMPTNFGATRPKVAMGIENESLRAYKLARDLMGNFDDQPEVIEAFRTIGSPFIRWASTNFSRWAGMWRNVWSDPRLAERMGARLLGKAAIGAGLFALKALALNAMLEAWNRTRFPEEERRLRREMRGRLHVILGYHPTTGELMVLRNLGSWEDAVSWFGMDQWRAHLEDYLNGRKTAKEVGTAIARQSASNAINAVKPAEVGAIGEALAGKSLYPDAFNPRPIRDRLAHGLSGLGAGSVVKDVREALGNPDQVRSVANRFLGIPAVDLDRDEYQMVREGVREFLTKKGKAPTGELGKQELYDLRNAIRWKDEGRLRAALKSYGEGTGTPKGVLEAVERTSPLASLPPGPERKEWVEELKRDEAARLIRSMEWWRKEYAPNATRIDRAGMPLFNWINAQEGIVIGELKRRAAELLRENPEVLEQMRENQPRRRRRGGTRRKQ